MKLEGKKLLENLGIIKNTKQAAQPAQQQSRQTPSIDIIQDTDRKQKKRTFSFKSGRKEKDKKEVPRTEGEPSSSNTSPPQRPEPQPKQAPSSSKQAK